VPNSILIHRAWTLTLSSLAAALLGSHSLAGPLNPPAGPVAPTPGPEPRTAINNTNTPGDANSVFKITQPGSYYLTGNVAGVAAKHGIEIAASGVTIDLNGFDLVGAPGMGPFDAITTSSGSLTNITIRNGSVRNWGDDGIDLSSLVARACIIEGVRASGNADVGIAGGENNTISGCTAYNNVGSGITSNTGSTIVECASHSNGGVGFSGSTGGMIVSCNAYDNTGTGIYASQGSKVTGCTSFANEGDGILLGFGCTVAHCSADNNTGRGFDASNGTVITDCSAAFNGATGFFVYTSVVVRNCNAIGNALSGIDTSTYCLIENCVASSNVLDGINCGTGSVVRGNLCRGNGDGVEVGAGIHATGNDTRIEGNNCTGNDYGIDVDGAENIIIKNTCGNNTTENFNFAANNIYGTIVDRTAPVTAAVAGNAAVGTMGSSDPNANFAN
jgi:parallel beta-helix repeat protein